MTSKTSLPLFGPQSLFNLGTHTRRAQLPARTFQLLARRTSSDPKLSVCQNSLRWLHTTHRTSQPSTVEINSFNGSNPVGRRQVNIAPERERRGRERKHNASVKATTDRKKGGPFERPRGRYSFRHYMRRVCHPVAIVTSTDTDVDSEGGPKTWRGATVSSFNSVTMHPTPYVSFNIKTLSSTYDAIKHSRLFMIHVMGETAEAAAIATHFSRGNSAEPFFEKHSPEPQVEQPSPETQVEQPHPEPVLHSFVQKTANWFKNTKESSLPPTIQWFSPPSGRGVLFHSLCEFKPAMSTEVGDHVIVIGKVLSSLGNLDAHIESGQYKLENVPQCLTYENGEYLCKANPEAEKRWNLDLGPGDSDKEVKTLEPEESATEEKDATEEKSVTKHGIKIIRYSASTKKPAVD